jgi:predicted ArsR family transcriptional regulator
MDSPVAGGELLAQPTRARLFALLAELRRSAPTEELASRLGLHVNGVRRHLERLHDAGVVDRARARHGRGRPRDEWAVSAGASPGGEAPRGYHDLASWLARTIPSGPGAQRRVEREGREIGRELAPEASDDLAPSLQQVLAALGFQPDLEVLAGGSIHCRLRNCPYRDSARANPEIVCTLHRGITSGLLDRLAPASRLERFEPHDPDAAGCRIEVHPG